MLVSSTPWISIFSTVVQFSHYDYLHIHVHAVIAFTQVIPVILLEGEERMLEQKEQLGEHLQEIQE